MKKSRPQAYQEWLRVVIKQMSHLSKPQAVVLAMWSFAIAMTHVCGLSTVTVFLAEILEQPENTVKERLRQWYLDGGEKKGKKRSLSRGRTELCPFVKLALELVVIFGKKFGLGSGCFNLGSTFYDQA